MVESGAIKLILILVSCEAVVELWKKAAPIQPIREWLVKATPMLYSQRQQTHLLECNYCFSVYAGILAAGVYTFMDILAVQVMVASLAIHRLSNYLHLCMSYLRDKQMDLRVARNKR